MKKQMILRQSLLAGVVAVALTGCMATSDEVMFEEENVSAPVVNEQEYALLINDTGSEDEMQPLFDDEIICDSQSDDCVDSEDYLTTQFVQETDEDIVALSRPAGAKAVSVKDKEKEVSRKQSKETVLYTTVAIPEVVDGEEKLVSEKTNETIVTVIQKPEKTKEKTEELNTENVQEDVVAEKENVVESSPMIPLKKVKTTITETTTKVEKEKPQQKEWSADMTLAERIEFGQSVQEWDAVNGSTLRTLLRDWADKAGWTVVWKLDRDYNLQAGVIFTGTFTDVSAALIRSFARATPAPIGTFYQGNRVLVINTQEDENER